MKILEKTLPLTAEQVGSHLCVMVLNESVDTGFEFDLALNNDAASSKPLVIHADAGLKSVISESIAPQSTQLFVFDASGRLMQKTTYTVVDNLRMIAPTVERFQ